jgi:hypothetical protein
MKHIGVGSCCALIASLLIGLPLVFAQSGAPSLASEPVRLTVAPNVSLPIAMKTLPKAVCILHAEGDSDVAHSFKVFANDEGMIRFQVRPSAESEQIARLAVDCAAGAKSRTFELELRSNAVPTLEMPAPQPDVRAPQPGDVIRPALTEAEAHALSGEELVQRGYPVRPDEQQAPEAFAAWRQAVTKAARRVDARQVANPDVQHGRRIKGTIVTEGPNWSGFELKASAGTYDLVEGEWNIPTANYESNSHTYSALWVGLDGDHLTDLLQAGTEQDNQDLNFGVFHIYVTTYYAWSEFLPLQPTEMELGNFAVSPGDLLYSEVWVGNAGQLPSLSGLFGIAFLEDVTRSEFATIYTCRGLTLNNNCTSLGQVIVGGSEAEWIMERPTVGGSLPDLTDYYEVYVNAAYAQQPNFTWVPYSAANNEQMLMFNGNDLLSMVYPWATSEMLFYWDNWH